MSLCLYNYLSLALSRCSFSAFLFICFCLFFFALCCGVLLCMRACVCVHVCVCACVHACVCLCSGWFKAFLVFPPSHFPADAGRKSSLRWRGERRRRTKLKAMSPEEMAKNPVSKQMLALSAKYRKKRGFRGSFIVLVSWLTR